MDPLGSPFQPIFWKNLYTHMYSPDWFFVAAMILGVLYGMNKGPLREIVETLEFYGIMILSIAYGNFVTSVVVNNLDMPPDRVAAVCFVMGLWMVWFGVAFVDKHFPKVLQMKLPSWLNNVCAGTLGAWHFILIWALVSHAIYLLPTPKAKQPYNNKKSLTASFVRELPDHIYNEAKGILPVLP